MPLDIRSTYILAIFLPSTEPPQNFGFSLIGAELDQLRNHELLIIR